MTDPAQAAALSIDMALMAPEMPCSREKIAAIIRQHYAPMEAVVAAAKEVHMDASGRSGGSVFMVHRDKFLALRDALAAIRSTDQEAGR